MFADLQISLGKAKSVPTCLNGFMMSYFSAKEPCDTLRGMVGFQSKFVDKICKKMIAKNACKPMLGYMVPHFLPHFLLLIEPCSL